jgi:hypothetical protein
MHRSVLATLMLAATLAACAAPPDPAQRATLQVVGHHCDGERGIDAVVLHVDTPGLVVLRWSNRNACGDPA